MKKIVNAILKEVSVRLETIESEEQSVFDKSLKAIEFLEEAFNRVKIYISEYTFLDEEEEIHFFKETKPEIYSKLLYYAEIYKIGIKRPNGSNEVQKDYILKELDRLKDFFDKNIECYQYYRTGRTHLDKCYFLRGKSDIQLSFDSFVFERDLLFSTCFDYKIAKILANELLRIYLNAELQKLELPPIEDLVNFPKTKKTWTRSKTDLVELLYAICETDCFDFGKTNLKRMTDYFESVFNIDMGNIYHTYVEIKGRTNRTQFLDELRDKLNRKMDEDDQKR